MIRRAENMPVAVRIGFLLAVLAWFASCTEVTDIPNPTENDPAFQVTAEVADSSFRYVAGENGYYMFTSFTQDSLGVLIFRGRLAFWDCLAFCPRSLSIEIRDFQNFKTTGEVDIVEALSPDRTYTYFREDNPDTSQVAQQQFSAVTIEYTNEQGTVLTSETIDQGIDSYFRITSASDFEENIYDEPTRQIGLEFEALLESAAGEQTSIRKGVGTFAFSFPED